MARPSSSKYHDLDAQALDIYEFDTRDIKFMGLILGPIGGRAHTYYFPQEKETESTFDMKSFRRFRDEAVLFYKVHKAVCDYFFKIPEATSDASQHQIEEGFEDCVRHASEELGRISQTELLPETPKTHRRMVVPDAKFDRGGHVLVSDISIQKTIDRWSGALKKHLKKMKYNVAYRIETLRRGKNEDDFNKTFYETLGEYRVHLYSYNDNLKVLSDMLDEGSIEEFTEDRHGVWYTDMRKKDDSQVDQYVFLHDKASIFHYLIVPREIARLVLALVISSHKLRHDSDKIDYFWNKDAKRFMRFNDVDLLERIRDEAKEDFKKEHPQYWES